MKFTYLLINFFSVLVPLVFSFHPRLKFYKTYKAFLPALVIVAVIFIVWDMIFTQKGVWGFNSRYVTGIYILNIPLEEVLFFICIPYACLFTYHCLNLFFKIEWRQNLASIFCVVFALILLITGFYFHAAFYTSITFISTGVLLLLFKFIFQAKWMEKFISIFPVLLIPFFIVNGILTGTGLSEPVVWYNNQENLNIRLLTIPIEDIIYGFELIMLNIFFYELFKKKI